MRVKLIRALEYLLEIPQFMKDTNVKSFDKYSTALKERFEYAEKVLNEVKLEAKINA